MKFIYTIILRVYPNRITITIATLIIHLLAILNKFYIY